jgi:hypothetical protein
MVLEDGSPREYLPFEDAAMLFRYVNQLATGNGIVWNAGQTPGMTDGATDLGFVLALAPFVWLGISPALAALFLNGLAVAGLGALFGILNVYHWRLRSFPLALLVVFLMSGPVNRFVESGFSPPVFAFLLMTVLTLALLAGHAEVSVPKPYLIAAAGVVAGIAGWWRPEGFGLALIPLTAGVLLSHMIAPGTGQSLRAGIVQGLKALASALPGYLAVLSLWVLFRVVYFGQLLPTSAVMKGRDLHWTNFQVSLAIYITALLPLVAATAVLYFRSRTRGWVVMSALLVASLVWVLSLPRVWFEMRDRTLIWDVAQIPMVLIVGGIIVWLVYQSAHNCDVTWIFLGALLVAALAWVMVDSVMNHWWRMQWPLVPVLAALALTVLVSRASHGLRFELFPGRVSYILALILALSSIGFQHLGKGYYEMPFHSTVAAALNRVDTSGVRLATTEAGLIPLSVAGPALDTYGLNDRVIAESGGVALPARLREFLPNVLVVHGRPPFGDGAVACPLSSDPATWNGMVEALYSYTQGSGMRLIRSTETGKCDAWSVFVSEDVPPPVESALMSYRFTGTELVPVG